MSSEMVSIKGGEAVKCPHCNTPLNIVNTVTDKGFKLVACCECGKLLGMSGYSS